MTISDKSTGEAQAVKLSNFFFAIVSIYKGEALMNGQSFPETLDKFKDIFTEKETQSQFEQIKQFLITEYGPTMKKYKDFKPSSPIERIAYKHVLIAAAETISQLRIIVKSLLTYSLDVQHEREKVNKAIDYTRATFVLAIDDVDTVLQ